MNPRRALPRGVWSALLAVALACTVFGATARAQDAAAEKGERGGPPAFAKARKGDGRNALRQTWKSQRKSARTGQSVNGALVGIVGRASLVINGAGTVVYTKNFLGVGATCDPNIQAQSNWTASHVYAAGAVVRPTGGFSSPNGFFGFNFIANNGGTSAAVEPTWPRSGIGATVNDNGIVWRAIGFDPGYFVGCTGMQIVSRASGGPETVIAQEGDTLADGSQLAGWNEFIATNGSGQAAFRAALAGYPYSDGDDEGESGILTAGPGAGALTRIAATSTTIGGRSVCGLGAMVGINDAGQVVFDTLSGMIGNGCDEDNHGLTRFTSGPGNELLVGQGSTVGTPSATVVGFGSDTDPGGGVRCSTCTYQNIDGLINSAGHVPVVLNLSDGTQGVFNFTGPGTATQVARSGGAITAIGPRVSINNGDQVVYRATSGGVDRLFRFTPPSTTVTIVSVGDVINGHTISNLGAFTDINNSGNVVYGARFAGDTLDGFYYWDGTSTEIVTGTVTAGTVPLDSLASEMITLNDSNFVAYITGTNSAPDEVDQGAEGHETGGLFTWTKVGGSVKQIAVGDVVGGLNVTGIYAQHTSFVRRNLSSAGCVAMEYFVNGDDAEQDCDEGNPSAGCYPNGSGILFVSCGAVCPTITLSPPTLPGGSQGTPYSQQITAVGGAAPYTFTLTSGTLPAGITLTAAGLLSGTPTVSGSFPITITATDINACTGSQAYTLVIGSPTQVTITITPSSRTVIVGASATLTVTINIPQATDTIVTLTSSNPAIASVPATVTILANQTSATFLVTGVAVGGPVTITATLPPSFGAVPATASVTVVAQVVASIPTLSGLGLAILAALLAAVGILLAKLK